jgi:hypothetical protein
MKPGRTVAIAFAAVVIAFVGVMSPQLARYLRIRRM